MIVQLVAAALLASAAPAAAPPEEDPAALYDAGERAYKAGNFEEALPAFTRSYELSKEPALLFNIGQCHRQMKQHERAIHFFEGYLKYTTDAANRAEVEALVVEERALLEDEQRAAAAATPAPAPAAAAAEEGEDDNTPFVIAAVVGAASAVVLGGALVAIVLWPAPEPPPGSLGTIDLRGGG